MKNLIKLPTLFKRDTTGKIRMWEVEYAETDIAGSTGIQVQVHVQSAVQLMGKKSLAIGI